MTVSPNQMMIIFIIIIHLFIYLEFISDNKHKYTVHSYS